ncbi:MAG TPA: lysophospholipid acyltransferase family protein [Candidatus Limnocylindria bacterium]|jgi:1-acyl-sn-glycerol-3-phosphate acyltransferase|nr:lysophospholipid acyltransferase family protein [Candidatus Limnocylindria bacterium]
MSTDRKRLPWQMSPPYFFTWHGLRVLFWALFRWKVFHPDRVPATGPCILASNHASFIDPPLVGCGIHRAIYFLARDTLFTIPIIGAIVRTMNSVPVDREGGGGAGLKAILDRLQAGGCILLFPEGTRTKDGQVQLVRPGIGLTIIKSEAPVVPARVFGTFEAWGRHRRFPKLHPLAVKYGKPVDFSDLRTEARTCSKPRLKAIYQEASLRIMAEIAKLEPCSDVDHFGRT